MTDFSTILNNLLSPEGQTRQTAEDMLTQHVTQDPVNTLYAMIQAVGDSNPQVSRLSLVLIKRKYLDSQMFLQLGADVQGAVKMEMMQKVTEGLEQGFAKLLANVLVQMAELGNWIVDLFQQVNTWSNSSTFFRMFSLHILQLSTDFEKLMRTLQDNSQGALSMIMPMMDTAELQVPAVKTTAMILSGIETEEVVMQYSQVAAKFVTVITQALQAGVTDVQDTLTSLSELTENAPRFWMNNLYDITHLMQEIAITQSFDDELRASAVELMTTILIRAPGLVKKSPDVIQKYIDAGLKLTNEVDFADDLAGWNAEQEQQVIQNDPYGLGRDLLNKAAVNLGGDAILPHLLGLIPSMLQDGQWSVQHTGILALGIIAEGCHKKFEEHLSEILGMIVPFAGHENPRLRYATLTTLGLLCTEFEPTIQQTYHSQIINAILPNLAAGNMDKVKTQGVSAIINYGRGILSEDSIELEEPLLQYTGTIFVAMAELLQYGVDSQVFFLLEETLKAISIVASALQTEFAPYYSNFMGALKQLIQMEAGNTQQQEVRANAIRCVGHSISSVSDLAGEYAQDAVTILQGLITLKGHLDQEDPATLAIYEVVSSFAGMLKQDFWPYMENFLPQILQNASNEVDIQLTDAEPENQRNLPSGMNAITLNLGGYGNKQLAIHTTALQNKIQACKVLYDIVNCMGTAFHPYALNTVNTLTPLFTYAFNTDVRKYSLRTVANCVGVFEGTQEKEAMLLHVMPSFTKAFTAMDHFHPKDTKRILKAIQIAFEEVTNVACITLAGATELSMIMSDVVKKVFSRKAQRKQEMAKYNDPEVYLDELAQIQEDDKTDDYILRTIVEIVSKLLMSFNAQFQPVFTQYFTSSYSELLTLPNPTEGEILAGVCIFADYVYHTKDVMPSNDRLPLLEEMLKHANSENADIRQSGIYGVGVCAEAANQQQISAYLDQCIGSIQKIMTTPGAFEEDNITATENAIGALGRIAVSHRSDLYNDFVGYLPLKHDEEEARAIHKMFLKNVSAAAPEAAGKVVAELKTLMESRLLDDEGKQLLMAMQ